MVKSSGHRVQSPADAADILFMTGSRCPACGAATPETVPWCSLCYADLRPVPAAAVPATHDDASADVPPAPPAAPAAVGEASPDPLTAPISTLLSPPAELPAPAAVGPPAAEAELPADAEALPGVVDPQLAAATWPCARCGAAVPLLLDACNECGAGFLTGAIPPATMSLPIVGDVQRLSKVQRFALATGLAVAIVAVFLALATIGGAVL
jgi:hypothetical protein